jgi:uncharacterized protein (DUF927 family)
MLRRVALSAIATFAGYRNPRLAWKVGSMAKLTRCEFDTAIADQAARLDREELFSFGAHWKRAGRDDKDKLSGAGTFKPRLSDMQGLATHIAKGVPWMPGILNDGAKRGNVNVNKTELLALDIDNGLTIEEALGNPFIAECAGLIIESAGSKVYDAKRNPDSHEKFRIVFRVDGVIEGWESIGVCQRYLMNLIPESDDACKDPARFFFGAEGREPILINESARLPQDFYDKAVAWWETEPQAKKTEQAKHQSDFQQYRDANPATAEGDEQLAERLLRFIPRRVPGSNTYGMYRNILWSLCHWVGVDKAITMMEAHSPSSLCGWDIAQVARSGGGAVGTGTLYWYAQQYGFEPPKQSKKREKSSPKNRIETTPAEEGDDDTQRTGFHSSCEEGLIDIYREGKGWAKDWLGNHLTAIAYVENTEESGAALLMEFKTIRGEIRRVTLSRNGLAGNSSQILDELLNRGWRYNLPSASKIRDYLMNLGGGDLPTYAITDSTGWVGDSFVMPHLTVGDQSLRYRDVQPPRDSQIEVRGTTERWYNTVGKHAVGNSRLIFGIGTAFAGPLMHLLDVESGGFHLVGQTSQGKTTTLIVAASVIGLTKIPSWHVTINGLEGVATAHNHLLMPLDEVGEANPRDVGAAAYMLANGKGKQRMTRDLTARKPKIWQTLVLSTGELTMADYLKQGGMIQRGGQEIRTPDIPAVVSGSFGVFETIHNAPSAADFVTQLERDCRQNCGAVFQDFLTRLVAEQSDPDWIPTHRKRLWGIVETLMSGISDAPVGRAAKRFALVQLGLEIAYGYGLLPLSPKGAAWAVKTMFSDWLNARGGTGSIEVKQALERIEHLFVTSEHSDRIYQVDTPAGVLQTVRNLLAYRKNDPFKKNEEEFWVPPAVFNAELAKDADRSALIKGLQERGWLKPPDTDGKTSLRRYLNEKRQRFYVFTNFWKNESSTEDTLKSGVPGVPCVPQPQNPDPDGTPDGTPPANLRDTAQNKVSHENSSGVPQENLTENGFQPCGTHGTHGTPEKQESQEDSAITWEDIE